VDIKKLKFKNFRSYGHIEQVIKFKDIGSLIAVIGESGSGKTVIKEVFEYVYFGKVRSRRKPEKWALAKNLPNRRNKDLKASVESVVNGKILKIERGMSPNVFNVTYNNKVIDDNKQVMIERIIGLNSDTYQSFISFSQGDVLNFISLTKGEKDNIINKLLNLKFYFNILNLSKKIQDVSHHNSLEKQKKSVEKNQLEKELQKSERKIATIENNKDKVDSSKIDQNKETYTNLNSKQTDIIKVEEELSKKNNDALKKYYEFQTIISNIKEKLELYNKGVCPYCSSELKDAENIKIELDKKALEVNESFKVVEDLLKDIKQKTLESCNEKRDLTQQINEILVDTKTIKNTIELQKKIALVNNDEILQDIDSFKTNITDIDSHIKKHTLKNIIYEDINSMLSLDGELKKEVLRKALPNINDLIKKFVKELDFEYDIEVLDTLKVEILQYNVKIDSDDPSDGEIKRANLIIMFAFMTYSAFNSKINFMFLDELLEGLDLKSTKKMLDTLKHVSYDMNINMFLICHKLQDLSQFDKIIKVEKNFFSSLSVVENNI
jgi:DNA repair exonuclease SbcCD ATPase subunit